MSHPRHPFESLFARLTQAMSAPGARVPNDLGPQADAQITAAERLVWNPVALGVATMPFELPESVTPWRQAVDFKVSVHGSSFARVLELHRYLVGWLDLLIGPPQGCPPSEDAAPAVLRGAVDLTALSYPYSGLAGLHLDLTEPAARSLAFGSSPFASPQDVATAVSLAATSAGLSLRARLHETEDGEAYLELLVPTDPLSETAVSLALDPSASGSACAALGFSVVDGNVGASGSAPTTPYRPGYVVGETAEPGPSGGDLRAQNWGVIVPVRLYLPIESMHFLTGVISSVPMQVVASGDDAPDEIVVDN